MRSRRHRGASCGLRHGIGERLKINRLARRNLEIGDVAAIGPEQSADNPGSRSWGRQGLSWYVSKPDRDMQRPPVSRLGNAPVLFSPFRAGAAHVVQLGPV